MDVTQKLLSILLLSGWTQEQLAHELHVSFPTVNSWIHGKSSPRKGAHKRIDTLFTSLSGVEISSSDPLMTKKQIIDHKRRTHKRLLDHILSHPDVHDQLVLSFTYHTNRIEGSTLSEAETAAVLFDHVALPHKTLTEQLEAKNHQTAILAAFQFLKERKPISEELLRSLHGKLMNGIRDDAGMYRIHAVRIVGANVPTANPQRVPQRMSELIQSLSIPSADVMRDVARVHATFEQIHPFSDGNGRVGRLIMLIMLLEKNIAPAVVLQKSKQKYYRSLQRAQQKDEYESLEEFLCEAVLQGYRIVTEP